MSLSVKKIIKEEIAKLFELEELLEKYPDLKERVNIFNKLIEENHEDLKKLEQSIFKVGIGDASSKLKGFDEKLTAIEAQFKAVQNYMDHFLTIDNISEQDMYVADDLSDKINMYVSIIENLRDIVYDYNNSLEDLKNKLSKNTMKAINSLENTPKDRYKIFMN